MDNLARPEFVKWTRDVLSTTQVSSNVVILAMLFIYRLKIANPSVKGKSGSEYRLLTVALMLGNKCECPAVCALNRLLTRRSPG